MKLIDADALLRVFNPIAWNSVYIDADTVLREIRSAPSVDAELVKHGRWITHNKGQNNWCECSECNTVGSPFWKRCPVCEAKMDGV